MVESRVWVRTEAGGGEVIFVYVQTQVGTYAYRQRGDIIEMRNVIAAGLTNAQVEALFVND